MAGRLKNLLARLRAEPAPGARLAAALRALAAVSPDLDGRTARYVESGAGAEVLGELAADDRPYRYLGGQGPGWHYASTADEDAVKAVDWTIDKGTAARSVLVEHLPKEAPEVLARYGRVLDAVRAGRRERELPETRPAWLATLVAEAFWPMLGENRYDVDASVRARAAWTPAVLEAAVRADGDTDDEAVVRAVLTALLDLRGGLGYGASAQQVARALPAVRAYVARHAGTVHALVPAFSLEGRAGFLELAAADDTVRDATAPTIAALLVDPAKTVRTAASAVLAGADPGAQAALLAPLLPSTPTARSGELVAALLRLPDGAGAAVLQEAVDADPDGRRTTALREALDRGERMRSDDTGPVRPPYDPLPLRPLGEDFVEQVAVAAAKAAQDARNTIESLRTGERTRWTDDYVRTAERDLRAWEALDRSDFQALADYLSGERPGRPRVAERFNGYQAHRRLPPLDLAHLIRLQGKGLNWYNLGDRLPGADLRAVADLVQGLGGERAIDDLATRVPSRWSGVLEDLEPEHVWPFYDQYPKYLEEGLGLRPPSGSYNAPLLDRAEALEVLARFPALPPAFVPPLVELAMGEGKQHRLAAQRLLERHAGAPALARQGLTSGKAETRASAAAWLARIGDPAAVEPLRAALVTERRETVTAALLNALEALGDDISGELAPDRLVADARKGLRAKRPAGLAWFPFDRLPPARFADGSPVPPELLEWWVVLAAKLKDPSGAGLLARYLGLLDPPSRAALGEFVLTAWIAEDTRRVPDDEARAHAAAEAPAAFAQHQKWRQQYPQYYDEVTEEQIYERLRRERASQYLGSAIGEKGVLALATGAPGVRLAAELQAYFKEHYPRRAQVEALLVAAASSEDPAAMQLVLSVARRYRTAGIQQKARELVEGIAERRGWTAEELADRTVPSAGFDESGLLRLSYGERSFTGRITEKFTLELAAEDGEVVKALPAARQSEDAALVAEAKAQLSASRKELKQVVQQQTQRLYEAMCVERTWPVADWREYLAGHPVLARLVQRLVWQEVAADGGPARLFRPEADGTLLDAADDEVTLGTDALVKLAHGARLDAESVAAWRAHLKDYAVKPLFEQLGNGLPEFAAGATAVADRKGWTTDTFTIRGLATKRGYGRSAAEDGGWFTEYGKEFASADLRVVVEFTGSMLPEENIPAAVLELGFRRLGRSIAAVPLREVPSVLLAEAVADYHAIASGGSFDPDWQKRTAY